MSDRLLLLTRPKPGRYGPMECKLKECNYWLLKALGNSFIHANILGRRQKKRWVTFFFSALWNLSRKKKPDSLWGGITGHGRGFFGEENSTLIIGWKRGHWVLIASKDVSITCKKLHKHILTLNVAIFRKLFLDPQCLRLWGVFFWGSPNAEH